MAFSRSCPPARRGFALLLAVVQLLLGCPPDNPPLAPTPGLVERREVNRVRVPGGVVDVAGGNFLVHRADLVLDTRLGRESLGALYDSASGGWRWSFESRYDGSSYVDESGASFPVAALAPGAAIPGTHWVKLDATRMQTKGGLVHEYGVGGLLAARHWASDPYPRIVYRTTVFASGATRVTAIEQCTSASACSSLFALAYDAHARLVSIVDRAGRRAEFGWDASGRLVTARDALDVAEGWPGFRYGYVGTLLVSITNSEGERTSYAYVRRALASAAQGESAPPAYRFQYEGRDAASRYHTRFWNPLGEERRFAYDAQGRLLEQREVATGELTSFAWSGERMTMRMLPNGATTRWVWSADDASTRIDPSGNVVTFGYAPGGVNRDDPRARAIASVVDSLGPVETRSYDPAGRLIEIRNGEGEATRFVWGALGTLASTTAAGVTRSFAQYGEHGHAARVTIAGATETRVFDAVGNRVRGSDGTAPLAGGVGDRSFDADRNLASVTLHAQGEVPAALTVTLEHRSDARLRRVLRGGDDHEFAYDAFGHLVARRERVDGAWQTTQFGYDAAGRLLFVERPNGMREEWLWGPVDRIVSVRRLRGGVLESTLGLTYQDGELVRVDDSETGGAEHYAWDPAGRLASATFADGERLDLEWDLRSRVVTESFVAGAPLGALYYEHDLADRRVRVSDATGELLATTWEGTRPSEIRYGNGLVRSLGYGPEGGLTSATTRDAAGGVVEATEVSLELSTLESGELALHQRARTTTYGAVAATTAEEYDLAPYDGASFEHGARIAVWGDGAGASESYAFDARSNLLAMGAKSLTYNAEGNRLRGVWQGGAQIGSYRWDAAGFATWRNGVPLAWNAAGRLVAHGADSFRWDGLGRLRETRVAGVTAGFRFGGRVRTDASGNPLAVDLGEVVVGFGGVHRYRHLDFRGNVKWVSDDAGQVVSHYRYAPFGLDAVYGADDDAVRFAARPEIGELMLLGARVYDPAVGRFLSPDPIFQIVNQFAYTLGNPVWFGDPNGLSEASNNSASAVVDGVAFSGAMIGLVGRILAFAPTPVTAGIGTGLMLLGAILVALAAAMRLMGVAGATTLTGSGGGSGGEPGGTIGSGGSGCAPAGTLALPNLRGWLGVLIPLQLLLGWLLLRRRRERRA